MNKLKRLLYLLVIAGSSTTYAQDKSVTDGPYIRYADGRILLSTIEKDDDLLQPKSMSYALIDKPNIVLNVVPEEHLDWAFQVKLKMQIANDPSVYPAADKTLFISDIEGEFANFRQILLAAKVIDQQYHWTYGKGSLVITGDLFDRGKDVVTELWLLYKLEEEAKVAGGLVQVILGNHDIMNLSGDYRYTDTKYFKDAWLLHTDINDLFDKDTELGRWLRSKNVIGKVGDVLVIHGGMAPTIQQRHFSLEQLNAFCRPWYDVPKKGIADSLQLFFGKDALFWYRGYFLAPKISEAQLDQTLKQYGCRYILVGHTIVKWNIAMFLGGKVIGIDIDEHKGKPLAALYQNGRWQVINDQGKSRQLTYKPENDQIKESDIL